VDQLVEEVKVDSGRFSLVLFRREGAVVELYSRMEFAADEGEDADGFGAVRVGVTVEETVESALEVIYFRL
jgi:hypothetical protein